MTTELTTDDGMFDYFPRVRNDHIGTDIISLLEQHEVASKDLEGHLLHMQSRAQFNGEKLKPLAPFVMVLRGATLMPQSLNALPRHEEAASLMILLFKRVLTIAAYYGGDDAVDQKTYDLAMIDEEDLTLSDLSGKINDLILPQNEHDRTLWLHAAQICEDILWITLCPKSPDDKLDELREKSNTLVQVNRKLIDGFVAHHKVPDAVSERY